jgi:hypothetical protein
MLRIERSTFYNADGTLRGTQALKLMIIMAIMVIAMKIMGSGGIVSCRCCFMKGEIYLDTHSTVYLLGPRLRLDVVAEKEDLYPPLLRSVP